MVGFHKTLFKKKSFQELSFTFSKEIPLEKIFVKIFGGLVTTDFNGKKRENWFLL